MEVLHLSRTDLAETAPGTLEKQASHAVSDTEIVDAITENDGSQAEAMDYDEFAVLDSLDLFLKDLRHTRLLTAEEEIALAKRVENGDQTARNRMVESNLRLVVANAKRYRGLGVSFGDLIQEGSLGLFGAVNGFDWRREIKFSTYATPWIQQAQIRALEKNKTGITNEQQIKGLKRVENELVEKLDRQPTTTELAHALDVDEAEVNWLQDISKPPASLQTPIGQGKEQGQLGDFITDPVDDYDRLDLRESLESELSQHLTPAQLAIVRGHSELDGEKKTFAQLGKVVGVCTSAARQKERQAFEILVEHGGKDLEALRLAA
jgi:RNA polymerase primary sigma factor